MWIKHVLSLLALQYHYNVKPKPKSSSIVRLCALIRLLILNSINLRYPNGGAIAT